MIPPFDPETGLLPPHPDGFGYPCSAEDVRVRLVEDLGSTPWRVELFDGWRRLHAGIADLVPSARWWLWGCFVTSHAEPLWADRQWVDCLVQIEVSDLPAPEARQDQLAALVDTGWAQQLRVDLAVVYVYPTTHPGNLVSVEMLESKWRPRATVNIADHEAMELVPAGFLEVVT